jgi:hypothetical protein
MSRSDGQAEPSTIAHPGKYDSQASQDLIMRGCDKKASSVHVPCILTGLYSLREASEPLDGRILGHLEWGVQQRLGGILQAQRRHQLLVV